jgi:cell division protein FtsB
MRELGNLAIEPDYFESEGALDWASPAPSLARRVLLDETAPARKQAMQEKAKAVRRNLAIRRFRSLASLIVLIIGLSGIFGSILYRQARILEQNFANLKLERTIEKTNQSSGQISESLARQTNLDLIRSEAVNRLGLQKPAGKQVVVVDIPNADRVVYASTADREMSQEAMLADVFTDIEGFFKTLTIPGQGA